MAERQMPFSNEGYMVKFDLLVMPNTDLNGVLRGGSEDETQDDKKICWLQ
jgi:hypothetical protein